MASKYTRTVIITGGTINLGYYTALNIAQSHPNYLVVISSRSDKTHSADAINAATGQKNVVFISLDLFDLDCIRKYASDWSSKAYPPIQSLVLNAGLQFPKKLRMAPSGLEATFAICHVGHALLFHLLCPHLAPEARVVVVSSSAHDPAQKTGMPDAVYNTAEDLAHPPPSMIDLSGKQRYSTAKLANVLWTYGLDRKLKEKAPERGITVNAFDPGTMPGSALAREYSSVERFIWNNIMPKMLPLLRALVSPNLYTPEQSGQRLAALAVGPKYDGVTGKYIEGLKEINSSVDSYDVKKQEDLWQWTVNYLSNGDRTQELRFQNLV